LVASIAHTGCTVMFGRKDKIMTMILVVFRDTMTTT